MIRSTGEDAVATQPGVDKVLVGLSDPTRRTVLLVLARTGGATASELADLLPVSRQAIGKHIATLIDAGLVTRTKHGREVVFRPDKQPLIDAGHWLIDLAESWDDRLAALKRVAESGG